METSDRIEKRVTLRAPVARVWRALADSREFGSWFGVKFEGEFAPGKAMKGKFEGSIDEQGILEFQKKIGLRPTAVKMPGPDVAFCTIDRMEPERYMSFRWIPYAIDAEAELEQEATTLVEFRLEAVPEGTLLTIVESGFDRVPARRRERAFRMNEGGWAAQSENIKKYVEQG
jgi:uncharacterized protein YndB with AHSA1/START domain